MNANAKKGDEKKEFTYGLLNHIQLKYDNLPLIIRIILARHVPDKFLMISSYALFIHLSSMQITIRREIKFLGIRVFDGHVNVTIIFVVH